MQAAEQPCDCRRGKPVKPMRLNPAEKAFAFARQFQGQSLGWTLDDKG